MKIYMNSREKLSEMPLKRLIYSYIKDITRWRENMNFIFECTLIRKIRIFKPPCNFLFII